jgi:hypothetical protein
VLLVYTPAVRVVTPPTGIKDARAWLQAGGSRADLDTAIQTAPVWRLQIQRRRVHRDS